MSDQHARHREKLVEKVRKLLALAADTPNQAESETALAIARRIMLEHGIEEASVAAAKPREWTRDTVWEGERRGLESDQVLSLLSEYFFVRVIVRRYFIDKKKSTRPKMVELFGRPEHVAIAKYVYVFLTRAFRRLWELRVQRLRDRGWKWLEKSQKREQSKIRSGDARDYYLGLRRGFANRLELERRNDSSSAPGLIRADQLIVRLEAELDAAVNALATNGTYRVPESLRVSADAFRDGLRDGGQIEMRTPLSAQTTAPRRLEHADH